MTYEETLHYLFTSIPVFQHSGASAYKPGLGTSKALDDYLGNPHKDYKTIHIAGTNGKGSTSHLLAAILQEAGYTVGLFTSPHLVDFRERIRVNGKMISEDYVIRFVERYRPVFEPLQPSFFELTSSLAFDYFRDQHVDFAVIEVGLGGRLDSTNIITPILSVITNISMDHTQFWKYLRSHCFGKGRYYQTGSSGCYRRRRTTQCHASIQGQSCPSECPLYASTEIKPIIDFLLGDDSKWRFVTKNFDVIIGELGGLAQARNATTVLTAVDVLRTKGVHISPQNIEEAFAHVVELTGLMGRWQTVHTSPRVVCDTGHNTGGWEILSKQLNNQIERCHQLRMIVGMVNDKDINGVLALMPKNATYYFTQASIARALPAEDFAKLARQHGLNGNVYPTVEAAVHSALEEAQTDDFIFIGGSTFIVADAYPLFQPTANNQK